MTNETETRPQPRKPNPLLRDFSKRLQRFMEIKGWNQAELARQASLHLNGKPLGRDSVSLYLRGMARPRKHHLTALTKALGITIDDLIPSKDGFDDDAPAFNINMNEDGNVHLRINQIVDKNTALMIMGLLGKSNA